ncbi:MAG: hypothetical protein L6R37_007904 [Teloschistes peruensis]|nr:MAG: hypothetical protein L6R37_007904 [Teloschistes peruensis]
MIPPGEAADVTLLPKRSRYSSRGLHRKLGRYRSSPDSRPQTLFISLIPFILDLNNTLNIPIPDMAQVNQNPSVGASTGSRTASLDYAAHAQSGQAMSTNFLNYSTFPPHVKYSIKLTVRVGTAQKAPPATTNQSGHPRTSITEPRASYTEPRASFTEPRGSITEERLEKEGRMPALPEANQIDAKNIRPPGTEDAGGNKIHRKGFLKKLLHWEHNGMNAD